MASSSGKRGTSVEYNERNVIASVVQSCLEEGKENVLKKPINKATERVALYCNVSTGTVKRIRRELKTLPPDAVLPTPGTIRKRPENRNAVMDDFDVRTIRDVVQKFYLNQRTVPTCSQLLQVLRERINFTWSDATLRRILKEMGFVWKACGSRRKILIEKENIVDARCEYLQKIRQFRNDGTPIFYFDQTWIDRTGNLRKCWNNKKPTENEKTNNGNVLGKVHIVHIGGSNGFLDGCELVYTTADNQQCRPWEIYKSWICESVIPALEKPSVIVVHNICFQEKLTDSRPTKLSSKKEMVDYLRSRGIPCEEMMRKFALMSMTQNIIEKEKSVDHFENLFAAHGHTVVRLPMHMCDLNPMELIWRNIRDFVEANHLAWSVHEPLTLSKLEELVFQGIKRVKQEDWEAYVHYVCDFEKSYWERDNDLEQVMEQIICDLEDSNYQEGNSVSSEFETSADEVEMHDSK